MERVNLTEEFGKRPARRWRCAPSQSWQCRFIAVGQLADGRWYAHHTALGHAFVWADEASAHQAAQEWMADGRTWTPMPAALDSAGRPADGARWVKSGGEWLPA